MLTIPVSRKKLQRPNNGLYLATRKVSDKTTLWAPSLDSIHHMGPLLDPRGRATVGSCFFALTMPVKLVHSAQIACTGYLRLVDEGK